MCFPITYADTLNNIGQKECHEIHQKYTLTWMGSIHLNENYTWASNSTKLYHDPISRCTNEIKFAFIFLNKEKNL